jgi:hypothetical protein
MSNPMIRSKTVTAILWLLLALASHLCPAFVHPATARGPRKDDIVFNSRGVPLAGASEHVCNMPATGTPCTTTAQIYSDPGLTQALANPTTTDGMGNYFFYAPPGQYEIEISGANITTKQMPTVILPSDPANPAFISVSATGGINAFTLNLSGNLTVNGSTSVLGNMASGTLTLSNQLTAPGAASAGTVTRHTKTTDRHLYYKDETGTEVGPQATASGARTSVVNSWTVPQYFDADYHSKGANPTWDVSQFGGYTGTNFANGTTGSIGASSATLNVNSALDFAVGQGILVLGAGPAPVIATPQAPTITPVAQTGSTSLSYCIADTDWFDGRTPCSAPGATSTGVSSFSLKNYSVSGWSASSGLITITTSAAHNIPSSPYNGNLFPQIEVQSGTTNSPYCEGAWTVVAVPSGTSVQITRYGVPDSIMNACSGGTLRVLPRVAVVWDSHMTYTVRNAACSGSTATLTVSPGILGANNQWVVPTTVKSIISGVSDSHYNTTTSGTGGWNTGTSTLFQYPIDGGSCSGVNTGNLGGTVKLVPGKAVKNHLIYRCSGASCSLPAHAANYSLVGVAVGNDGYFMDIGVSPSASSVDLGDASPTAPTAPTNDYLSTTISNISGTAFTLAANATNAVSAANVFHDNTPNLLEACAAMPLSGPYGNGGHIIIPAPTIASNSNTAMFPIMANLDTNPLAGPCRGNTTFDFRAAIWLQGTILVGKQMNFISDQGSAGCTPSFYVMGPAVQCVFGYANPMLYFEPEQSSNNYFANLAFFPNQPYQSAFYYDQQLDTDGTVSQKYENVHVNGNAGSLPIVDKAGFGRYWNYGGWSAAGGNFATQHTYQFTQNCGMPTYLRQGPVLSVYLTETHGTYNFGTASVDGCGLAPGPFQNATFNNMLGEGQYGPAWLFNTLPYGITSVTFNNSSYSDGNGGFSTPFYDLTNSATNGVHFIENGCGQGYQSLLETAPSHSNSGVDIIATAGQNCSGFIGSQSYTYRNLATNVTYDSNFYRILTNTSFYGAGQVSAPSAPTTAVSSGGSVPTGKMTYSLTVNDFNGNETSQGAGSVATVTSGNQTVTITFPESAPAGASGWNIYRNGFMVFNGSCTKPQFTIGTANFVDRQSFGCGNSAPSSNTTVLHSITGTGHYGAIITSSEKTETQCFSSASPAACGANIDGFVTIAAGSRSVVVATTSVTAKSEISLTFDTTQGPNLSVTCNITPQQPYVSARTPSNSFTISVPSNFSTNPGCVGFHIKN